MSEKNLVSRTLSTITIAADARVSNPNYVNDQIWELTQNGGEPQAIALQTTYGLRAKKMRMFPRFSEGHDNIADPKSFERKINVQRVFPNYIEISFVPLDSLEVSSEYWVPSSNAVVGRIIITNTSSQNRQIKFEWVAQLNPSEDGLRITPQEVQGVQVLVGASGNLTPVVFITGGASTVDSPYPALVHKLDLLPGKSRQFFWCHAALNTTESSFSLAREFSARNWEAEIARLELHNLSQVDIYTGSEEWNNAFMLAQKTAFGLFIGKTDHLENLSFATTRLPDDGYSYRGDGSDYGPQWNGQTPFDSYYLANLILPSAPNLAIGILNNSLNSINENGEIDWKPGLGGQLSNRLATPLLASLAWRIYHVLEDKEFLRQVFPKLLKFFYSWFSIQHDRDEDGIPEWDHPIQAGFDDHPIFARWHSWAQGIDITTSESPSLCSFLYKECQILINIAKLMNLRDPIVNLEKYAENLRIAVENAWDESISSYTYWDRDSHERTDNDIIGEFSGSGEVQINQIFSQPRRLVFRISTNQETTRKCQITIHGLSLSGKHRVESIPSERILWFPGWGTATSDRTYSSLEFVKIQGLDGEDSFVISSAGLCYQDITTLLPIWAKIPSEERAETLVENTITNKNLYWRRFGLPACPDKIFDKNTGVCQHVYLPWCLLIGEGLVSYGFREDAAKLVTHIMDAITKLLEQEGCFRQYFNADTGQGRGEPNSLWGLAPLGLFLETLGIQLISHWKIRLEGKNPFPWPVTVKYRGTTILRGLNKTQVVFPDGQTITIDDPEPRVVSLEYYAEND